MLTGLALGLAFWAGVVAVFALLRPLEGRHVSTMDLSITLLRYDEGLSLLAAHSRRSESWWVDAEPADRQLIDRALSMCEAPQV